MPCVMQVQSRSEDTNEHGSNNKCQLNVRNPSFAGPSITGLAPTEVGTNHMLC
jgi:hypothetical protein